jgi:hypothetical protein
MSDTVSGAAIAGSLDGGGWTFLALPDVPPSSDALHVNGAAHADPVPAGLLVEFCTLSPDLRSVPAGVAPIDPSPSVAGSYALLPDAQQPAIVAGALQVGG